MQACELMQLAARVSFASGRFLNSMPEVTDRSLANYWSACRCRADRWGLVLMDCRSLIDSADRALIDRRWRSLQPVLIEILLSEPLTRVVAAIGAAYDKRLNELHMEPISRSIHVAHLEARNRTLKLLAAAARMNIDQAESTNRIRRLMESWTDVLLAPLQLQHDVGALAFGPGRCRQFAADLVRRQRDGLENPARSLTLASLQATLEAINPPDSPNADLNAEIAAAVGDCLRLHDVGASFDGDPRWLDRMQRLADDTQQMIDRLFELEQSRPKV